MNHTIRISNNQGKSSTLVEMKVQKDKLDILEYLTSPTTAFVFLFSSEWYSTQTTSHSVAVPIIMVSWVEMKQQNYAKTLS